LEVSQTAAREPEQDPHVGSVRSHHVAGGGHTRRAEVGHGFPRRAGYARVNGPSARGYFEEWSTPCPASSSAKPRSILASRTSRSIASSSVASAGNFSIASSTFCFGVLSGIRSPFWPSGGSR